MTDERKPLATPQEIVAAYPEHAKYRMYHDQIQAIREFLSASKTKLCVYEKGRETPDHYRPLSLQEQEQLVFKRFGLDYDVWMAEKADILRQLELRWNDGKDVTLS